MSYQKLQVSQSLKVIPSNDVMIPNPDSLILIQETGDFTKANEVTVAAGGLLTMGILQGAIVYNLGANIAYYVLSVDSDTVMNLSGGGVGGAVNVFNIFNSVASQPCVLYSGSGGDIIAVMAQDTNYASQGAVGHLSPTLFVSVPVGTFMPTQVIQVIETRTTAENIIALW